jgi:hypothetical protein
MHDLRDFRPDLHAAIGDLHRAGFDGEAYVLAASMEGAYSSALEMVQAIRAAVLRVERALGADIPREVSAAFQCALAEVARVVTALTSLNADTARSALVGTPPELARCSSS